MTADSHATEEQSQQPARGWFRLFTVEDLESLPEPTWLIEGILPAAGLAMVYGEPGAYKTFLGLDWTLSVSAGLPWHGHGVGQGDVVYVYAEGAKGLAKRIKAWRATRGGDVSRFRALPTALDLRNDDDIRRLCQVTRQAEITPALVVIDTLARCFGDGDENAQKDMNAFVAGCDAIRRTFPDVTVLVVHHAGKNPRGKDRGSTVLRGAADTVMLLKLGSTVQLSCEKQKDAEAFDDINMAAIKVTFGDGGSSCVLERTTAHFKPKDGNRSKARVNDEKALKTLRTLGADGATYSEWQKASLLAKSTFKDALRRLVDAGRVHKDGARYHAVQ